MTSHFASRLPAPRACRRAVPARVPPRPDRRLRLQFWLVERPWGRILLYAWCALFRGGKWSAARSGIARGLRETGQQIVRWLRKRE